MSERWVNAVLTIVVPMAVSPDASRHEKTEAMCRALDRYLDASVAIGDDAVVAGDWEVVEDGEPVEAQQ